MFSDVGETQVGQEMTECPVAGSCRGWMMQQERHDDRRLIDGMMERAVDVVMMSEGGDDLAGQLAGRWRETVQYTKRHYSHVKVDQFRLWNDH